MRGWLRKGGVKIFKMEALEKKEVCHSVDVQALEGLISELKENTLHEYLFKNVAIPNNISIISIIRFMNTITANIENYSRAN